jgi:hypothetical protein
LTLHVLREVGEQLMSEISEVSTYEQVTKFAPGRNVFHGAMQTSAVGITRASVAVDEAHLLANMFLPLPVAWRAQ